MITMGSGVWAGAVPLHTAWDCEEVHPSTGPERRTVKQELSRIGFLGEFPASWQSQKIAAHFELHIEQGPILEIEGRKIGVVTSAQAYQWYEIGVHGQDSHAGTTPLQERRDTLLAAARMIVTSNDIAKQHGALVTTGIIHAEPGSVNTIARTVKFTLDVRHPSDDILHHIVDLCRRAFADIARNDCGRGVEVEWRGMTESNAVKFHPDCVQAVEDAAEEVCSRYNAQQHKSVGLWKRMTSGASHDSCHVSKRCPTAMVFVPTKDGMSHTPNEYCSPEDCVLGAEVLLGSVLRYDAGRFSQEHKRGS
jgi:hydantoinase/carbamoylase family amidase